MKQAKVYIIKINKPNKTMDLMMILPDFQPIIEFN
jgi:hypothetical protein